MKRIPQFSGFERKRRGKISVFVTLFGGAAIFALAALAAGYFFFHDASEDKTNAQIEFAFSAPDHLPAGTQKNINLQIKNSTGHNLHSVKISVSPSSGIQILGQSPLASEQTENFLNWTFESLEKNEELKIALLAIVTGPTASKQVLEASMTYTPDNFQSAFEIQTRSEIEVEDSGIVLEFSGPESVFPDEEVSYTLRANAPQDQNMARAKIRVLPPLHFEMKSKKEEPLEWFVDELVEKNSGKAEIIGHFTAESEAEEKFAYEVLFPGKDSKYEVQNRLEKLIKVEKQADVSVQLLLNASSESAPLFPGQKLNYSLLIENNSEKEISSGVIKAKLVSSPLSLVNAKSLTDQYRVKAKSVEDGLEMTWTQKEFADLKLIKPGEKRVLNFSLALASADFLQTLSDEEQTGMKLSSQVSVEAVSEEKNAIKLSSNMFESRVSTDLSVQYVSSGPISETESPEKVLYTITGSVNNSLHEVSGLELGMIFADNVSYEKEISLDAGEFSYDASAGGTVWTLNRLPKELNEPIVFSFQVSVPAGSSAAPLLIKTSGLRAKDAATHDVIELEFAEVRGEK